MADRASPHDGIRSTGRVRRPAAISAEVRGAVGFLTRLPAKTSSSGTDRSGAAAFAAVGGLLGLIAVAPIVAVGSSLAFPAAILALAVLVVASGGLHVDGLADTADALAAPNAEAAERARADPDTGPAGVAAIVLVLGLDASLVAALVTRDVALAAWGVVVAGAGSRAAPVVAAWLSRRGGALRGEGLAGWFESRVAAGDAIAAVATTIALTAVAAITLGSGLVAIGTAGGALAGAIVSAGIVARRGRLDGDGHGAIVEIVFAAVLAGVAVTAALIP